MSDSGLLLLGCLSLLAEGIVFAVLNELPFKKGAYRRKARIRKSVEFMFPLLPRTDPAFYLRLPFRVALATALICIPLGASVSHNYLVAKLFFVVGGITGSVAIFLALVRLAVLARYIWSGLGACLVAVSLTALYSAICPTIVLGPPSAAFGTEYDRETHTFTITNASNFDIYSTELRFGVQGEHSPDEYEFQIPNSSRKPITSGSAFADTVAMNCTNKKGTPIVVFQIFHLAPQERREILFIHKLKRPGGIQASVTYFTDVEQPRVSDPHTMCQHWIFWGEELTCPWQYAFSLDENGPKLPLNMTVKYDQ